MSRRPSYSDEQLSHAVAQSRSWRGVLRALGIRATSSAAMRSARAHSDRLALDYSHFTGQRRWIDAELREAVASSRSWGEVAVRLGLAGGSSDITLKGHAARLGLTTAHFPSAKPSAAVAEVPPMEARGRHLSRAGNLLAAAWLNMCGYDVSWPLEPAVYDLVVGFDGQFGRVQVKTTTRRAGETWIVRLTRSATSTTYDPDDIDYFFVIDGDLHYYLIPVALVGGLQGIHLAAYADYRLDRRLRLD